MFPLCTCILENEQKVGEGGREGGRGRERGGGIGEDEDRMMCFDFMCACTL